MTNLSNRLAARGFQNYVKFWILLFGLAPSLLFSQTRGVSLPQARSGNQAISEDVVRPFGEYHYQPQTGLYRDVTLSDVAEDTAQGVRNVGAFLNNLNVSTGWSFMNGEGLSSSLTIGVGNLMLPTIGASWGNPYEGTSRGHLQFRAGPMMVDNITLTYGLLYADLEGNFPGRAFLPPDDRWIQMVTLTFRASFALGDSLSFSIQPFLYWMPDTGEVGWGVPGPLSGFMGFQPNALALFQLAWNKQIGNWNISAYDWFTPQIQQYNIWDIFLNSQPNFGDLTPVERVGRYQLGFGAGDLTNYTPRARVGFAGQTQWDGLLGYTNIAGVRAVGTIGESTQSLLYFNRGDFFDSDFNNIQNGIQGGAYLATGSPDFRTYAGYNFVSSDPYDTFMHWAVVGAIQRVGPSTRIYAQAGYLWSSGGAANHESSALGSLGMIQSIGLRTNHYIEIGRRVLMPTFGPYGVENYIDYRINHMIGNRFVLSGFLGQSERELQGGRRTATVKYAGAVFNGQITDRLMAFASSGWAYQDLAAAVISEEWTHRLGVNYNISQTVLGHGFYQYLESSAKGSVNSFSEHFIYLGLAKRF